MKKMLIVMLLALVLTSCDKVDNDVTADKDGIDAIINVQAPKEHEPQNNNVNSNNSPKDDSPNGKNYKVLGARYNDKEVSITYPQIINLNDSDKQERINEILKSEGLKLLRFYENTNDVTIKIDFKIMWKSQNVLSIQYQGYELAKGAPYSNDVLYTLNIDVNKASKLMLKDYIQIDKNLVDTFRRYKVKDPDINQASAGAFDYIMNTYSDDDLIRSFNGADSSYNISPFIFSYLTEDSLGISIEVPNAVGNHTEIKFKYQYIKENINYECEIWKDFSDVL